MVIERKGRSVMKRNRFLALFASLCLLLTACSAPAEQSGGQQTDSQETQDAGSEKVWNIGFCFAHVAVDNYQTTAYNVLTEYAKTKPEANLIIMDALMDANTQVSQIEDLITQKVDLIVIWSVNPDTISSAVKKAHDAGIPVLTTDAPINEEDWQYLTAHVSTSGVTQGVLCAEMMLEALGQDGGNVLVLQGAAGYAGSVQRDEGYAQVIAEHPELKILDAQPVDWSREKSQTITENLMTKYGSQVDGILCANDNVAISAINALQDLGYRPNEDIMVTSCNMYADGYDLIKEGLLYGSEEMDPGKLMMLVLDTALNVLEGREFVFETNMELLKVTAENIDSFTRPTF